MTADAMKREIDRLHRADEDRKFLLAVIGDMARKLRATGRLSANDRRIFGLPDMTRADIRDMPTLLELLEGYYKERSNGAIP